jgi:hypothetical protein
MTPEKLCSELNLDLEKVWNIYPYGSKIYGTSTPLSDEDFIIVFKNSLLDSGAFKDNAISNSDRTIQGTCYSRGGFIDAINNYSMPTLEAISLSSDKIIQSKFNFKLTKFDNKELVKKVITQSSASWHLADLKWKDEHKLEEPISVYTRKGIWHSLRILMFGIQFKEHQKIVDFTEANFLLSDMLKDKKFKPSNYIELRDYLTDKLKENAK